MCLIAGLEELLNGSSSGSMPAMGGFLSVNHSPPACTLSSATYPLPSGWSTSCQSTLAVSTHSSGQYSSAQGSTRSVAWSCGTQTLVAASTPRNMQSASHHASMRSNVHTTGVSGHGGVHTVSHRVHTSNVHATRCHGNNMARDLLSKSGCSAVHMSVRGTDVYTPGCSTAVVQSRGVHSTGSVHSAGQHGGRCGQVGLRRAERSSDVMAFGRDVVSLQSDAEVCLRDLLTKDVGLGNVGGLNCESPQEPQSTSCDDPPDSSTGGVAGDVVRGGVGSGVSSSNSILKQLLSDSDSDEQNEVSACSPETTHRDSDATCLHNKSHVLHKVCRQQLLYACAIVGNGRMSFHDYIRDFLHHTLAHCAPFRNILTCLPT